MPQPDKLMRIEFEKWFGTEFPLRSAMIKLNNKADAGYSDECVNTAWRVWQYLNRYKQSDPVYNPVLAALGEPGLLTTLGIEPIKESDSCTACGRPMNSGECSMTGGGRHVGPSKTPG